MVQKPTILNCHTIVFKASAQIPQASSRRCCQLLSGLSTCSRDLQEVKIYFAPKHVFTESSQQLGYGCINVRCVCTRDNKCTCEHQWLCRKMVRSDACGTDLDMFVLCRDIIVCAHRCVCAQMGAPAHTNRYDEHMHRKAGLERPGRPCYPTLHPIRTLWM